jgi:FG-GAP repeat
VYWGLSLLPSGEIPLQWNDPNINCDDLVPEIGITATPVIDRSAGTHGRIFVVASSTQGDGIHYFDRLHALDLATGQDVMSVNITASVGGAGPANTFESVMQRSRAGLLLLNGVIYTAWGSYCDNQPFAGWIIAYYESNLAQAAVLNTDPNGTPPNTNTGTSGNGIWQSGNGPAVDPQGNIYVATGNGPWDVNSRDYGDSVLKLSPSLSVKDYFTPFSQATDAANDKDLGSGGPTVLPDIADGNGVVHHLLVQSGKDASLFLLDRDNLGKFHANNNSQIWQEMTNAITGGAFSSAAYFNGSVYYGGKGSPLNQFQFNSQAKLNPAASSTSINFSYPGTNPTVSSNGTTNGIVWAYENNSAGAVLHAYDARNLATEFFNSSSLSFGSAVKFAVPTVCNGKVFVGTGSSVAAFGLSQGSRIAKDFNNDRRADLIWENTSTGQRAVWLMRNGTLEASNDLPTIAPVWHIAGVGDFLGNGQSGLVWQNTTTGQCVIWFLANGTMQSSRYLPNAPSSWNIVGAGDFNGDGQADLVWENTSTGQRAIWILRAGILQSSFYLPTISTDWHIAGVGDFLGNGQSDLVFENTSTGQRAIWFLNHGVFQSSIYLPTVSTDWHIGGTADLNGGGQADLVWENTTTGAREVWLLKNGVYQSSFALPNVSIQWRLVNH